MQYKVYVDIHKGSLENGHKMTIGSSSTAISDKHFQRFCWVFLRKLSRWG